MRDAIDINKYTDNMLQTIYIGNGISWFRYIDIYIRGQQKNEDMFKNIIIVNTEENKYFTKYTYSCYILNAIYR